MRYDILTETKTEGKIMSLNYNVQEHLIIDLDRAGAAGSAVWEALVQQVRALEDLLDEDEVCIYRLELWADGEPVPVDRKISCAGLCRALKGARRMEMVLRFNSIWRGTDAVYDDALPFDLTETAAQLTDEELDGIFCSVWIQLEDNGELGRLVAIGRRGDTVYRDEIGPREVDAFPAGHWESLCTILIVQPEEPLTPEELTRAEQACRRLITAENSCNLDVKDGSLAFFLDYVLLSGQQDWLRLKAGMDAVCDIVEDVGMDIKLVDDSGPDVRLLVVGPQLDGSDCFGLYAIPEA